MSLSSVKDKSEGEIFEKCEDVFHLTAGALTGSILMVSVPSSAHLPSTLNEFLSPKEQFLFSFPSPKCLWPWQMFSGLHCFYDFGNVNIFHDYDSIPK